MKKSKNESGFTIIEVLIVMAIAGLILLIVFLAVPAVQRNGRNNRRKNDAALVHTAVNECLTLNFWNFDRCNEINELPLNANSFSISTGAHFGANCLDWITSGCGSNPPTLDEPNWLNGLICINGNSLQETSDTKRYVAGYLVETPGTPPDPVYSLPAGVSGRCL